MAAGEFQGAKPGGGEEGRPRRITVVITKRGKPVAELMPVEPKRDETLDI